MKIRASKPRYLPRKRFTRRTVAAAPGWQCPNCNSAIATSYCPGCGEFPLRQRDLTLRGLVRQIAEVFTNVDGPLIRSVRCLVTRPGALTLAYLQGQRKPYTLPLQLFLFANVLFFAMQSLTGAKIFSTPLAQHLENDIWGGVAQEMLRQHLEVRQTNLTLYTPVFNQAVALNAKSLIILMVLPFAVLPALVYYRRRRPFVAHVVFSLHFYAFLLLLLCVSLAVAGLDAWFGGRGLESPRLDHFLSIVELLACALYLYLAAGPVYGARGFSGILTVVPLAVAAGAIFLGYRFVLFVITLYST